MVETKLKYDVKDRNQFYNLPLFFKIEYKHLLINSVENNDFRGRI